MDNTGEPFGLPSGTVRGMIALVFTGAFVYLGVTGGIAPETLIGIGGPAVGYYFATRQTETMIKAATPPPEEVDAPLDGDADHAQADDVLGAIK